MTRSPDARLITACAELDALYIKWEASVPKDVDLGPWLPGMGSRVDFIRRTRARTLEGHRARAVTFHRVFGDSLAVEARAPCSRWTQMLQAIVRDLVADPEPVSILQAQEALVQQIRDLADRTEYAKP